MRTSSSRSERGAIAAVLRAACEPLALVAVLLGLLIPAQARAEYRRAVAAGDLNVRVTILAKDNTVTAKEPVVARIEMANVAPDGAELRVDLGSGSRGTTSLHILTAEGKEVARTPPRTRLDGLGTYVQLKAFGNTWTKLWVISGLHQFELPGMYRIAVRQLARNREQTVLAEDSTMLRVLPYDRVRLDAACNVLFEPLRKHESSRTDLPMSVRVKALYWVRDEVAVPYLEWMAREWHDSDAYAALSSIGTQSALGLVASLAAESPEAAKAARDAGHKPPPDVYWRMDNY